MIKSDHPTVMERRATREAPAVHFHRVAAVWSQIVGAEISADKACLMMAALKIVREAGRHDPDNVLDAIGYLTLCDEVRPFPIGLPGTPPGVKSSD